MGQISDMESCGYTIRESTVCGCDYTRLDTHAILAAAAPHNPGFQTFIILGSPRYAFYPSAQVALPWSNAAGITG